MTQKLTKEQSEAKEAREAATKNILEHKSGKKVVVAGPGTGKTYLFRELFASKKGGDKLTLTFINALVEDLSLELRGLSEVKTLHSYALSRFPKGKVKIFPGITKIICDDGKVLLGVDINFEDKIHEIDETDGHLEFYSARRKYYGHFDYSDIILGLVRSFQNKPEAIPSYSQIVVDEFQDFNQLEVTLIELLATKSNILIAGDDDQALYEFKKAHPKHIRKMHGDGQPEYASLPLPFCSRSTKVVVDSVNDIVSEATRQGFLEGRVQKRYEYFPCPEKDKESEDEPVLIHKRLEDGQIAWFIAEEMDKIAAKKRRKFEVLVISSYPAQCGKIGRALVDKGFKTVEYKRKDENEISYIDGLRKLADCRIGHKSNLGWRIASHFKLPDEAFADVLRASTVEDPPPFRSLVPEDVRAVIERDTSLLKKIGDRQRVSTADLNTLIESLSIDQDEIKTDYLREKLLGGRRASSKYPSIKKMPIKCTTIRRSKGLSAEYVFITHFDQKYLPGKDGITDKSICNMLVALTRARKKVWLISTTDESSVFLDFIDKSRIKSQ